MITSFGKMLRKIRIDHEEVLRDMAIKLGVSASFLSAIEVGKKNVPDGLVDMVSNLYQLNDEKKLLLQKAAKDAVNAVKINLSNAGQAQRSAALVFARDFDTMSDEAAQKIINFMKSRKEE